VIERARVAPASYRVPERSGEAWIDPPASALPALLEASRHAAWGRADILGTPLAEFRRAVRARALGMAEPRSWRERLSPDAPLVVMGHQPLFFHPGVWIKFFVLSGVHERFGAGGVYLNCDHDAAWPIAAEVPAAVDGLTRRSETLLDFPDDVPLEAAPLPSEREWGTFCDRVRGHLGTLAAPGISERFETFAAIATQAHAGAATLAGFLAGARRAYEAQSGPPGYLELAVSSLSDTREFNAFALHVMQDPVRFRARYNTSLEEYRRLHRLRSAANPFPNLEEADGFQEAPFWALLEGRRARLFARREGGRLRLTRPPAGSIDLPAGPAGLDAFMASGLRLRPKALTLTMFARLCLGDVFLHGVGGGRYDRVTDAVLTDVCGCAPPPYVVTTATLALPLAGDGVPVEDPRALDRRIMDLRHNPERYLTSPSDAQRRLVDEKWTLIKEIEQMRPGPERRAATHRIREVNAQLAAELADEIRQAEVRRAALDGFSAALDAATYRGYAYFLFDPAAVHALATAALGPA
jgi:hypothetical protein